MTSLIKLLAANTADLDKKLSKTSIRASLETVTGHLEGLFAEIDDTFYDASSTADKDDLKNILSTVLDLDRDLVRAENALLEARKEFNAAESMVRKKIGMIK